jgi:hypothetical protein
MTVRQFSHTFGSLFVVAALVGCGQTPPALTGGQTNPGQIAAQGGLEQMPRVWDSARLVRMIKAQLESDTPDATVKFRTLEVFGTESPDIFRFEGTADFVTRGPAGGIFAVEGILDVKTGKARITLRQKVEAEQAPAAADSLFGPVVNQGISSAIKDQLENRFCGPNCSYVISGVKLTAFKGPRLPESSMTYSFSAHERLVGHGWEERYSLVGTFTRGKADVHTRTKLSGNAPRY